MKRGLLVFLSLCALTTALVPRVRRAMNTEEEEVLQNMSTTSSTTTSTKKETTCDYSTPCRWTVYKQNFPSIIELNITNKYCVCESGHVCKIVENDTSVNTYIHRCRPPSLDDAEES